MYDGLGAGKMSWFTQDPLRGASLPPVASLPLAIGAFGPIAVHRTREHVSNFWLVAQLCS